jgi:hypothetical protein
MTIQKLAAPIKSRVHIIKTFRDRDEWLELLLAAGVSLGTKVVGSRIAHHHNVETGQCNPNIETLVLGTGISQSSVRRHVGELEIAGWLRVDRTVGRYSNSYELRVPTLSAVKGFNPVSGERVDEPNPVTGERVQDAPTLSTVTSEPCQNRPNPVTHERQNSESITAKRTAKEISLPLDLADEDSGRRSRSPFSETDAGFDIWYKQYPKQVDKADARKAYLAVIKKKLATPEQLMAAAMRYAAERTGHDPKYTKNPSTWLNKQSWLNESVSTGPTYSSSPPGLSNHIAVSELIARQLMERDGGHVQ